jgi:hypothetical protein
MYISNIRVLRKRLLTDSNKTLMVNCFEADSYRHQSATNLWSRALQVSQEVGNNLVSAEAISSGLRVPIRRFLLLPNSN